MTRKEFLECINEIMCGTSNAEKAYLEDLYNEVVAPHWIKVDDALPREKGWVLAVAGDVDMFEYEGESAIVLKDMYHITPWMPLPQLPTVAKNATVKKGSKE